MAVREILGERIHRASNLKGRFVLRSGVVSDEYFDKYLFESDPALLEDVITSGGQVRLSCQELRRLGAEIVCVVAVIDRESGGAANLAQDNLELRALFTMSELKRMALPS